MVVLVSLRGPLRPGRPGPNSCLTRHTILNTGFQHSIGSTGCLGVPPGAPGAGGAWPHPGLTRDSVGSTGLGWGCECLAVKGWGESCDVFSPGRGADDVGLDLCAQG